MYYEVATGRSIKELGEYVEKLIRNGFKPVGGITVLDLKGATVMAQAMVERHIV